MNADALSRNPCSEHGMEPVPAMYVDVGAVDITPNMALALTSWAGTAMTSEVVLHESGRDIWRNAQMLEWIKRCKPRPESHGA